MAHHSTGWGLVTRHAACEPLEARRLLAYFPTNFEQYQLELLNRARAVPNAEVTRRAGETWGDDPQQVPGTQYPQPQTPSLNEGLPAGTISAAAKQPLAFNTSLIQAARDYSQTLLDNNSGLTHTYGGTSAPGRMMAQGYPSPSNWAENIAISGSTGAFPITAAVAEGHHTQLFVDSDVVGRGHRTNQMNVNMREVGLGMAQKNGYTGFGGSFNVVLTTQDYATRGGDPFLTGVAYTDAVTDDDFYTVGEGLGGATVTATRTSDQMQFSTTTFSSGGYSLRLAAGTYNVVITGPGFASPVTHNGVVIGAENVKRDFIPSTGNPLPGDANGDGTVNVADLGILATNYGRTSGANVATGDFNGDGRVDVADLGILATNYGRSAALVATLQPQSASLSTRRTTALGTGRPSASQVVDATAMRGPGALQVREAGKKG